MTARGRWSEPSRLKRKLSRAEKGLPFAADALGDALTTHWPGLPNRHDKALVMPGEPFTEIDELIEAGLDPARVHGIDHDPVLAEALYDHYLDTSPIHYGEADALLRSFRGAYGYVHLDFCSHLGDIELGTIEAAAGRLAPYARLRVSVFRSRRGVDQLDREYDLHTRVVAALAQAAGLDDAVTEALARRADAGDSTVAIIGLVLLVVTFGVAVYAYSDACVQASRALLPEVRGSHRLNGLRRFAYGPEAEGSANTMCTLWCDLVPLPTITDEAWAAREIAQVMGPLVHPLPTFNNPELFS